ncbi:MAG: hypothetical protein M3068_09170 [Gemmatimonadota bacterium]|nr:hypothetical protein [Gemmatimonadota bacterium]
MISATDDSAGNHTNDRTTYGVKRRRKSAVVATITICTIAEDIATYPACQEAKHEVPVNSPFGPTPTHIDPVNLPRGEPEGFAVSARIQEQTVPTSVQESADALPVTIDLEAHATPVQPFECVARSGLCWHPIGQRHATEAEREPESRSHGDALVSIHVRVSWVAAVQVRRSMCCSVT